MPEISLTCIATMGKLFLTSYLLGRLSARWSFILCNIYFIVHFIEVEMCCLVWKDSLFIALVTEVHFFPIFKHTGLIHNRTH